MAVAGFKPRFSENPPVLDGPLHPAHTFADGLLTAPVTLAAVVLDGAGAALGDPAITAAIRGCPAAILFPCNATNLALHTLCRRCSPFRWPLDLAVNKSVVPGLVVLGRPDMVFVWPSVSTTVMKRSVGAGTVRRTSRMSVRSDIWGLAGHNGRNAAPAAPDSPCLMAGRRVCKSVWHHRP